MGQTFGTSGWNIKNTETERIPLFHLYSLQKIEILIILITANIITLTYN